MKSNFIELIHFFYTTIIKINSFILDCFFESEAKIKEYGLGLKDKF